jgi:hypothetical protein
LKQGDPKKSLAAYRKVLDLSKGLDSLGDENHTT